MPALGEHIIPIPGTRRIRNLEDNTGAAEVILNSDDLKMIEEIFPKGAASGARYPEAMMMVLNK